MTEPREPPARARDRDPVVGLRRLGHALRRRSRRPGARATSSSASTTPPRCIASPAPPARSRCTSRGTRSRTTARCASTSRRAGCASARSTRTSSRTPTTSSARSPTRTPRVREKAVAHLLECLEIAAELGSTAQSLWLADGTNYPGQDDLRERRRRLLDALATVYAELPADQELLVEYKLFEPAFYATDLADWGSSLLSCQKLGERAQVLVDLGHHAQGVEHRADRRPARRRGPARRLPLQQPQVRRRRPDRRLGQPVRAVPDLLRARRAASCRG